MNALSLTCHIYFGDILMTHKSTRTAAILEDANRDQYGGITYNLQVNEEYVALLPP